MLVYIKKQLDKSQQKLKRSGFEYVVITCSLICSCMKKKLGLLEGLEIRNMIYYDFGMIHARSICESTSLCGTFT